MALKLAVFYQRIQCKDYLDVAALLRHGTSLAKGLSSAGLFYENFPHSVALKALTWFQEGDLAELGTEDKKLLIKAAAGIGRLPSSQIVSHELCDRTVRRDDLADAPSPC